MKQVKIGNLQFSKVMCGTNPFYARSHFSEARNAEYRARFGVRRIEQMIRHCISKGVNAVETSASERILRIVQQIRATTETDIHLVGSTRIDKTSGMKSHGEKLSFLIQNGAGICLIHSQYVDRPRRQDTIRGLDRFVDRIHEAGLLAGISTHEVDTVELCEKKNYGIDVYMFPLNPLSFAHEKYTGNETVQQRIDIVLGVPKPFILIKALAAGRIPPADGLQFVAENSKPNDLLSIGFGAEEEIDECIQFVEKYF